MPSACLHRFGMALLPRRLVAICPRENTRARSDAAAHSGRRGVSRGAGPRTRSRLSAFQENQDLFPLLALAYTYVGERFVEKRIQMGVSSS